MKRVFLGIIFLLVSMNCYAGRLDTRDASKLNRNILPNARLDAAYIRSLNDGTTTSIQSQLENIVSSNIKTNQITGAHIRENVIRSSHIADNVITGTDIGINIIVSSHIANQGVSGVNLRENVILSSHIADNGIAGADIGQSMVISSHIAQSVIVGENISSGTVLVVTSITVRGNFHSTGTLTGDGVYLSRTLGFVDGGTVRGFGRALAVTGDGNGGISCTADTCTLTMLDTTGAGSGGNTMYPFRAMISPTAIDNSTMVYIGTGEEPFVAVSTTFERSGGGTILVREGTYDFNAGSTFPWNMTFLGSGRGTRIRNDGVSVQAIVASGTIRNITFQTEGNYLQHLIIMRTSATIDDCDFLNGSFLDGSANFAASFVRFDQNNENMVLKNSRFYGSTISASGNESALVVASFTALASIENCRFRGNFNGASSRPLFLLASTKNFIFKNNFVEHNGIVMTFNGSSTTFVEGNTFILRGSPTNGVLIAADLSASNGQNEAWQVRNNNFFGVAGNVGTNFVYMQTQDDNWTLANNYCEGMLICLNASSVDVSGTMFHGNTSGHTGFINDSGTGSRVRDNIFNGTVNPAEN